MGFGNSRAGSSTLELFVHHCALVPAYGTLLGFWFLTCTFGSLPGSGSGQKVR
jgi:hypothetical protein